MEMSLNYQLAHGTVMPITLSATALKILFYSFIMKRAIYDTA
jgi:hypothetical protein